MMCEEIAVHIVILLINKSVVQKSENHSRNYLRAIPFIILSTGRFSIHLFTQSRRDTVSHKHSLKLFINEIEQSLWIFANWCAEIKRSKTPIMRGNDEDQCPMRFPSHSVRHSIHKLHTKAVWRQEMAGEENALCSVTVPKKTDL